MIRLLSFASRTGLGVALFLLTLAVLRWGPVFAEPPWDVHALPLTPFVMGVALVAALTGRERWPRPIRPFLVTLGLVALALALVVARRTPTGLVGEVSDGHQVVARLPMGPVDVVGDDLRDVPSMGEWSLRWAGPLRAPEPGLYRIWVEGRGRVEVDLDGAAVLRAEDERLSAGADVFMPAGPHAIEVRQHRVRRDEMRGLRIRGHRLRLGWIRPRAGGRPGGRGEVISPRYLGPETTPSLWRLTDALALTAALLVAALAWVVPWDRPTRLPAPGAVTQAEVGWSLLGHAAVVVAMSWPLARDLAGSGLTGSADGALNTWILAWDVHALLHDPTGLFQAPIFHPSPDALGFSENLLVPAILAAPAVLLGNPVLGYNLVLLFCDVISGLGTQLLVRRVSGDRWAAFVAGVFFAAGAHRWTRLAHLHAHATLFLPFVFVALDAFWEKRTLRRGLVVGLLLALQGLSSIYVGAITATALAVAITLALLAGLRSRETACLGAGLALAAVLLAPSAGSYLRMRAFQGGEWTLADVEPHATTLESYVASGSRFYASFTQRHLDPERRRRPLFPGFVPLALGLAGLASAPRRFRAVALAACAVAVVLSLGAETPFYRFLHEHVVFFRGLRAVSRFSILPFFALAVLSGFALAQRPRAALLALVLALVEASQPLAFAPYAPPSLASRWLAGRAGAVAYLPLGERDPEVMLDAIAHFRPLLNGYSGFTPRHYALAQDLLEAPDADEALRFLRAVGVAEVVAQEDTKLPLLARFGADRVYAVPPGEAARVVVGGRPCPSLWSEDGIKLDLGTARPVGRIVFEVGDGPWLPDPRLSLSEDGVNWTSVSVRASLADATLSVALDPRRGRAALDFAPERARYLRLDPRLPARPGLLFVGP